MLAPMGVSSRWRASFGISFRTSSVSALGTVASPARLPDLTCARPLLMLGYIIAHSEAPERTLQYGTGVTGVRGAGAGFLGSTKDFSNSTAPVSSSLPLCL